MAKEFKLNDAQIERLLELVNSKGPATTQCGRVGRIFQWIDDNILSKTSRLWMYLLEVVGVVVIFVILNRFLAGLDMLMDAKTELALKKAQLYIESVKQGATPIAAMVATICGAIPTVIATFKSLNKKWKNGHGKKEELPIGGDL